ncbi:MAG: hypothetical protein E6F99_04840 [Actinobacteria bacterium]|nr:MAG: hypothetical protein E6F99_04840 [Actinomycetota bacterium]
MPRPARRRSSGPSPAAGRASPDLPELILATAGDLDRLPTSLDAELLLSTLLGSGYRRARPDRAAALDELVGTLAERAAGRLRTLLTEPDTVAPTGGYAYGDRYGDQTGYVVTFSEPEHAVVFVVDHTLGLLRDIVTVVPAASVLDRLRAETDEMTWSAPMELAAVRVAVAAYLRATDLADELPDSEALVDNRWLAGRRLALLPDAREPAGPAGPGEPAGADGQERAADHAELTAEFLAGPEARLAGLARASGTQGEAVGYVLGLCVDFAGSRGGDPLRWSPRAVEAFLLDWVHERAVLDAQDAAALPDVLAAWVAWAGRRVGLPEPAVAATLDRIDALRGEFARLVGTGERQSPAVRATAQLVAEGVDLADPAAVEEWLAAYNDANH